MRFIVFFVCFLHLKHETQGSVKAQGLKVYFLKSLTFNRALKMTLQKTQGASTSNIFLD